MNVYRISGLVNVTAFVRASGEEEAKEKLQAQRARLVNLKTSHEVEVTWVDFDSPNRPELALSPVGVLRFENLGADAIDLVHKGEGTG